MTIVSPAKIAQRQLPEWPSTEEGRGLLSEVADSQAKPLFQIEWRAQGNCTANSWMAILVLRPALLHLNSPTVYFNGSICPA